MMKFVAALMMMAVGVAAQDKAVRAATTFSQKQCSGSTCAEGCKTVTLPLNQCLTTTIGGSAFATSCSDAGLSVKLFAAANCTGYYTSTTQPTNQCNAAIGGAYVETLCGSEEGAPVGTTFHVAGERN